MRSHKIRFDWDPLPSDLESCSPRMQSIMHSWEGTPYASGQRLRGVACDCVGAVFGVIDDLDGRLRAQCPTLPQDTAFHNKRRAYRAVAALRRLYAPVSRIDKQPGTVGLQPGDILVVGQSLGGPGHLMIVGPQKNTIWHAASGAGFCRAGWSLGSGYERLFAVYRIGDRHRWLR